ncbi:MAG: RNA polymerase sigma factor [Ignavibacteriae bacterium]|nr:RNA polymerase sigma factor [Ignavibacteriota bacterium]
MATAEEPSVPLLGDPLRADARWDERRILQQAKDGNRDAFRLLMNRHLRRVYDVAYRFIGDHDMAEDITQETFVKVHAALPSFRGDAEFSTWLHRITVNIALTKKRLEKSKQQRHVRLDDALDGADCEQHEALHIDERRAHIERALHELPTLQRAVVILRHLNGLSTKQVSDILRCSEGTVKTHLFRGLRKMRSKLHYLQEGAA